MLKKTGRKAPFKPYHEILLYIVKDVILALAFGMTVLIRLTLTVDATSGYDPSVGTQN